MSTDKTEGDGVTRLSFLKASAGAAAGAAAVAVPATVIARDQSDKAPEVTEPSSPNPSEPVMAYVRDADRGEVTVMSGTSETTYRDPALVQKLLGAAPKDGLINGGGIDVLAP
jgi:hypothetical protein